MLGILSEGAVLKLVKFRLVIGLADSPAPHTTPLGLPANSRLSLLSLSPAAVPFCASRPQLLLRCIQPSVPNDHQFTPNSYNSVVLAPFPDNTRRRPASVGPTVYAPLAAQLDTITAFDPSTTQLTTTLANLLWTSPDKTATRSSTETDDRSSSPTSPATNTVRRQEREHPNGMAAQPNQPALTPQFCFSTVVLRGG